MDIREILYGVLVDASHEFDGASGDHSDPYYDWIIERFLDRCGLTTGACEIIEDYPDIDPVISGQVIENVRAFFPNLLQIDRIVREEYFWVLKGGKPRYCKPKSLPASEDGMIMHYCIQCGKPFAPLTPSYDCCAFCTAKREIKPGPFVAIDCTFSPPTPSPVEVKTIGELIDELIIANVKIFTMEDLKRESTEDKITADLAKKIQACNDQRSQLKNAITRRLEPGARQDVKVKT